MESKETTITPTDLNQAESKELLKMLQLLKSNDSTITKVTIKFHNYSLETDNVKIDFDYILTRCMLETQCPIDTIIIPYAYFRRDGLDGMLAILQSTQRPIKTIEFYHQRFDRFVDAYFFEDIITQHKIQELYFKQCTFITEKPIMFNSCIPAYHDRVCFNVNNRQFSQYSNLAIQGIAYGLVSEKSKIKKISFYTSRFHGKEIEVLKSALTLIKSNEEKAQTAFLSGFSSLFNEQSSLRKIAASSIFDQNAIKLIWPYAATRAVIEKKRDFITVDFQPVQTVLASKNSCTFFTGTSQTNPVEFAVKWHPVFNKILNAEIARASNDYYTRNNLYKLQRVMESFNPIDFSAHDVCELEKNVLLTRDELQFTCLNVSKPPKENIQRINFVEKLYEGVKILKNMMKIPDLNDSEVIFDNTSSKYIGF